MSGHIKALVYASIIYAMYRD